jgi:hypothetical protein
MRIVRFCSVFVAAALMVAACGGGDSGTTDTADSGIPPQSGDAGTTADSAVKADAGDGSTPQPVTYGVGGTVTGLKGTGLVVQNNAGDDLPIAADGSFKFAKKLPAGTAFKVSIKTQPTAPSQTCSLSAESGTVGKGDVTSVVVNCAADKFTVGGTVTGLAGTGLILQNNGGADLIVNANGTFAFPTTVDSGKPYAVTVKTQPGTPSQTCVVTKGSGTVASTKITDVAVTCTTNKFTVGGTVAGLTGTGLSLKVNGADTLAVPAPGGTFTFATPIASGTAYTVTIGSQPTNPSQTCVVMGGTGTVGGANVSSVAVNCTTNKYTIGGTASGVLGKVVLQNNGGNDLNVTADGTFAFSTPIDSNAAYAVTVKTQPGSPSQTCTLTGDTGNVAAANVTSVVLTCVTNTFAVKANVTGVAGSGLVLQNKGGNDLPVAADGTYAFTTPIASGQTYAVTVKTQPTGLSQTCTVTAPNGTVGATDVVVNVACVTNSYTVGGAVAGLTGAGLVLQDNLGDDLPVAALANAFTFAGKVLSGKAYSVTVKTQPSNPAQTCTVAAGSGTVTNGNVVTVMVNCTTNKYAIGGTITGLDGTGLVLQNNLGDDLTINNNANSFAFGIPIASGKTYSVKVKTQPTNKSQTCVVTPATATGTVGGADVTSVAVTCTTNKYTVGGTITGLTTAGLELQNNGVDDLTVAANATTFTFATSIASGSPYAVTVKTQPTNRNCVVTNGSGTVAASNVTNVSVTCSTQLCSVVASAWCTGKGWTVARTDMPGGSITCTAPGTSLGWNCNACDTWNLAAWKTGAPDEFCPGAYSTVASSYYAGHSPCVCGDNLPLCGTWPSNGCTPDP